MTKHSNLVGRLHRWYQSIASSSAKLKEAGAIDLASIMVGVAVMAVLAGVIAATVFLVIPWAQDNSAKSQLNSVVEAENARAGMNDGAFSGNLSGYFDVAASKTAVFSEKSTCYSAFKKSSTGKYFYVTSASTTPTLVPSPWPATAPVGFPAGCQWPTMGQVAQGDADKLQALLEEATIHRSNVAPRTSTPANLTVVKGYTMAFAWTNSSTEGVTIAGQEMVFKLQQGGNDFRVLTGTGAGWTDIPTYGDVVRSDGSTNAVVATVAQSGGVLYSKTGAAAHTFPAPQNVISTVTINGYSNGEDLTAGKLIDAYVWDRTLTPSESALVAKHLATLK